MAQQRKARSRSFPIPIKDNKHSPLRIMADIASTVSTVQSNIDPTSQLMQLAQASSNRDLFLSFVIGSAVIIYAVKTLYPILRKKDGQKSDDMTIGDAKRAFEIITHEDADGQVLLLSIPRILRDFSNTVVSLEQSIRRLVNHQEDTNKFNARIIEKMHESVQETLRLMHELVKTKH